MPSPHPIIRLRPTRTGNISIYIYIYELSVGGKLETRLPQIPDAHCHTITSLLHGHGIQAQGRRPDEALVGRQIRQRQHLRRQAPQALHEVDVPGVQALAPHATKLRAVICVVICLLTLCLTSF